MRVRFYSVLLGTLLVAIAVPARAQNCKKLTPAGEGRDDSAIINDCLMRKGRAKLKEGTFLLYGPVVFPREVAGVQLLGKGMDQTRLVVQSDCTNHWPFVDDQTTGQYMPIIQALRSPSAVVKELELDLRKLRQDCGHLGNYTILVNRSQGSEVTRVRIAGSQYGAAGYTTGGANSGGIRVVNSHGTLVSGNEIRDLGFAKENGGSSAGMAGLAVESSGDTLAEGNSITRVAFGILITNGSPQHGYTGNSSGTTVAGNTIVGAANINCPNCSQGRAIKLQACGTGDEPSLERITVSNNNATEFGGSNGVQGGSGLDLICGVRYSVFMGNRIKGAATAEFGLQIRSSFLSPPSATHHNEFNHNSFSSGRGQIGCNDECADVIFTGDGPDQIGISRNGADRNGTNTASFFRYDTDRGCNQYSHAFLDYLGGGDSVRQGESVSLAAAGVRPSTPVTFRFKRAGDGAEVATYRTGGANRNCVVNQEDFLINPAQFAPGTYQVLADYRDGNSDASISDDLVKTIKIKKAGRN